MSNFKRRLNIIVTAGPTREPIDPVRFISNYATGFLGYEIARLAKRRGHRVILISGPTALAKPKDVRSINVLTAQQMKRALERKFSWCNCLIMTAAVGDFRVRHAKAKKIKRRNKGITLALKQNPDILRGLGLKKGKKTLVGFALETEGLVRNARAKLRRKNLDLIVATHMKSGSYPFGPRRLEALIMDKTGRIRRIKRAQKSRLAGILLDSIEKIVLK